MMNIEITASKKDDLLQFLKGYEVSVYSNSDEGYDYLDDNDLMLVVKNPYCDETLDIELAGEFSLYFAGWHTHYFTYEYDYEEMKKDIMGLLKGDIGALIATSSESWLCSTLCKDEVSHLTDEIQLLKKNIPYEETIDKFTKHGDCIKVVYWNPTDTISFDVNGGKFVVCDEEESSFYKENGYAIAEERDADRLTAEDAEYLYGEIEDEVIIEICKQQNLVLPEDLREEEEYEDEEPEEIEEEPLEEVDIYIDDYIPEPPAPKFGFFGTLATIFAGASAGASSAQGRRHNGRCNGDCANCPPHYGYRYGRWYYGHDHVHGCGFGGNKGSGSMD